MSIDRLISEFGAQDVGAWMETFIKGQRARVAHWNQANEMWDLTEAGRAMLNPPVEEDVVAEEKPKAKAKPKAPPPVEKVGLGSSDAAAGLSLD